MAERLITQAEAIREGTLQAMAADPRVIVIGEGVPDPKGTFGTTTGLFEEFGPRRVFDMPIAENGMTGICIGAALAGMRPVMVHQRMEFALLCVDQLVNNAAKWRFMFAGQVKVPLVVRMIIGRGWGQGPQHSQSLQALFAHFPGLRVAMPATGRDAKGMMMAAAAGDDPVILVEHRWLHVLVDQVPDEPYRVPLEGAAVRRPGRDVTLVGASFMVVECLLAAEALAEQGIEAEVIDLRMARPLDADTVIASVRKTGALAVAETGWLQYGLGSEVVSRVSEAAWGSLRHAPIRIGLPDLPCPTSPDLSRHYYPDAETLALAVVRQLGRSDVDTDALSRRLKRAEPLDVPQKDFTGPF